MRNNSGLKNLCVVYLCNLNMVLNDLSVLPLSTFVMLIPRPGFLMARKHPDDVNILNKLLPLPLSRSFDVLLSFAFRSISDERHEDESSLREYRLFRLIHPQFFNIFFIFYFLLLYKFSPFFRLSSFYIFFQ